MSLIEKNEVLALIDEIINRDHLTPMARLFLLRCEVYDSPPAKSAMLMEFVKSLKQTDREFVRRMLEEFEREDGEA